MIIEAIAFPDFKLYYKAAIKQHGTNIKTDSQISGIELKTQK